MSEHLSRLRLKLRHPWQALRRLWQGAKQHDDQDPPAINRHARRRNLWVTGAVLLSIVLVVALLSIMRPKPARLSPIESVDFAAVITPDFSDKDAQSAMQAQQHDLANQQQTLTQLTKAFTQLQDAQDARHQALEAELKALNQAVKEAQATAQQATDRASHPRVSAPDARDDASDLATSKSSATPFPPRSYHSVDDTTLRHNLVTRPMAGSATGVSAQSPALPASGGFNAHRPVGMQAFRLHSVSPTEPAPKRTIENYVPAGSFVTAVLTGGADANAGVTGQGDTAPILFRTLNEGFLPNGKRSRIKDCFITAATYGEVSSSRGIVRTQRLSCIFADDAILDIPIQGTAFNFGRNGIRGTTVMRNGQIVQMAGISGLFAGLGDTAQAMSQTTSISPLGSTSTLQADHALVNLLGSASESVGNKLADYYIKMAEQYHPIIELNPGAIVNIVFLEGFSLDPLNDSDPGTALSHARDAATTQIIDVSNPLIEQLPLALQDSARHSFQQTLQSPLSSHHFREQP